MIDGMDTWIVHIDAENAVDNLPLMLGCKWVLHIAKIQTRVRNGERG